MSEITTKIIQVMRKAPFFYPLRNWVARRRSVKELNSWEAAGRSYAPPHIVKQRVLLEYSKMYGLRTLVETGTYYGDMVEALRKDFDKIYSIELSENLYKQALKRFKGAAHIALINGDSGSEIGKVLSTITGPVLFWLDGHYSAGVTARGPKDTPIYEELTHIINNQYSGHVIIIDDARCFGKDPAYPTLEELRTFLQSKRYHADMAVQDDMIRITPRK